LLQAARRAVKIRSAKGAPAKSLEFDFRFVSATLVIKNQGEVAALGVSDSIPPREDSSRMVGKRNARRPRGGTLGA